MNAASDKLSLPPAGRVLYTARVHTTGGRDGGNSRSDDARLVVHHSIPGKPGDGTNPEQLFAAGWSACFEGAMGVVAQKMKVKLPPETAIDAEVDLVLGSDGYSIQARLDITVPGMAPELAQAIVDAAEQTCPYSKATRGNINSVIRLNRNP